MPVLTAVYIVMHTQSDLLCMKIETVVNSGVFLVELAFSDDSGDRQRTMLEVS
jgi:hypothetical protein